MFPHPLESPWVYAALLAVLAAVLRIAGQRGGHKLLMHSAVTVILGVIVLIASAYLIQTPREAVLQRTEALIHATSPFDASTFDPLVDPDAQLVGPDERTWLALNDIRSRLSNIPAPEHRILLIDVPTIAGDSARSYVELRTRFSDTGALPYLTHWRIGWRRSANGSWRADRFEWLPSSPFKPDAVLLETR
jgi:hypothetical protein